MKDKKAIATSMANLKADLGTPPTSREGRGGLPGMRGTPPPVAPSTGIGVVLLAGSQLNEAHTENREQQARIEELEAKIASLMEKQTGDLEIDLNDLVIKPGRRRKLSPEQYSELKHNLAHNPLATPISVKALPGGRYELIAGHNRVDIYRELGRPTIRGTVLDVSDDEASRLAFYTNLLSLKPTDFQQYHGFKQRVAESGKTLRELETESGVARSKISRLMAFDKVLPEILDAIDSAPSNEWFSAYTAEAVSKMSESQQRKVLDLLPDLQANTLTLTALVAKVTAPAAAKSSKAPPRHEFKLGQKVVGELRHSPRGLSVSFRDDVVSDDLIEGIKALVASHLSKGK